MFGTFKIKRCSLDDAQETLYQAHFCGSCHALDEFGGWRAAATTNYDQVLLALVISALSPATEAAQRPCTVLKWRKVPVLELPLRSRRWIAAFNLALMAAKLADDEVDEPRLHKRLAGAALRPAMARAWQFLQEDGYPIESLRRLNARQAEAEQALHPTLETLSQPTADALGEVFAYVARETGHAGRVPALRDAGQAIGRFVYGLDAVRDYDEDVRRRRFNALHAVYGRDWDRSHVRLWLLRELRALRQALQDLPGAEVAALVEEVVRGASRHLPGARRARPARLSSVVAARQGDCDCSGCDCNSCDCSGDCCQGCCDNFDCGDCCDCCDACDDCDWCSDCHCGCCRRKKKRNSIEGGAPPTTSSGSGMPPRPAP